MPEALLSVSESEFDNLIGGDQVLPITEEVTLLSGQDLVRGTLLGKITISTPTTGTAAVGNTGNGTITLVTAGKLAKQGTYTILFTAATAFRVIDPNGEELKSGSGSSPIAYTSDHLNFTFTAGGTAMVAGDSFTVAVAAGSGKYVKSLSTAVDGSQNPSGILVKDTDASAGDVKTLQYIAGMFNSNAMTFGASHTAASVREALRDKNIYLDAAWPKFIPA